MEARTPTTRSPEFIGRKLRELREATGRSIEEVATEAGEREHVYIGAVALADYEQGRRVPRDEVKLALCAYFDADMDSIFFDGD